MSFGLGYAGGGVALFLFFVWLFFFRYRLGKEVGFFFEELGI